MSNDEMVLPPPLPPNSRVAEHNPKKGLDWGKIGNYTIVILVAGLMFWFNYSVDLTGGSTSVLVASLSIVFNVLLLAAVFATGIGKTLFSRFVNRLKYRSGKYVNTLYATKNGVLIEKFCKVDTDTGAFKIFNKSYTRNPSLLFDFMRIPTYIHKEGVAAPLNVFEVQGKYEISNAEIDDVMAAGDAFDLKMWLNKHKTIIFMVLGFVVLAAVAAAIVGYMSYEILRDSPVVSGETVKCVAQNIGDTIANTAKGGSA